MLEQLEQLGEELRRMHGEHEHQQKRIDLLQLQKRLHLQNQELEKLNNEHHHTLKEHHYKNELRKEQFRQLKLSKEEIQKEELHSVGFNLKDQQKNETSNKKLSINLRSLNDQQKKRLMLLEKHKCIILQQQKLEQLRQELQLLKQEQDQTIVLYRAFHYAQHQLQQREYKQTLEEYYDAHQQLQDVKYRLKQQHQRREELCLMQQVMEYYRVELLKGYNITVSLILEGSNQILLRNQNLQNSKDFILCVKNFKTVN